MSGSNPDLYHGQIYLYKMDFLTKNSQYNFRELITYFGWIETSPNAKVKMLQQLNNGEVCGHKKFRNFRARKSGKKKYTFPVFSLKYPPANGTCAVDTGNIFKEYLFKQAQNLHRREQSTAVRQQILKLIFL